MRPVRESEVNGPDSAIQKPFLTSFHIKGMERTMFHKSKITRTLIADLSEIEVELTESNLRSVSGGQADLRIVSGGLTNGANSCNAKVVSAAVSAAGRKSPTNVATGQDWDTDWV
jgi:hypothetical protein